MQSCPPLSRLVRRTSFETHKDDSTRNRGQPRQHAALPPIEQTRHSDGSNQPVDCLSPSRAPRLTRVGACKCIQYRIRRTPTKSRKSAWKSTTKHQLPQNLRRECTREDDPYESQWWRDSLRNLAQDCRADCPHLKAILVSDKCTGVLPIDEDIRKLKAQFREQGVSLLIKGEHLVTPIPAVQEWKRLTADCDIVLNGMGRKSKMHTLHIYNSHNNDCLLHNRHGSYPGLWQEIRVGGRASAMGSR